MNQAGVEAIQYMSLLMSHQKIDISLMLELVELVNRSYFSCQNVITILQDWQSIASSGSICYTTQILQYLVKNANRNFHQAANKQSFQKKLIHLLKRLRGKSNFLKDMRSNIDNWNKIQAKVLYLVQLWYDAFILEEGVYNNIINTYKTLRKENILFPPRSSNEKNLLFVQTQSPILDNIEQIARSDHKKFQKKLNNMGMDFLARKMNIIEQQETKKKLERKIDIDEISERIAIVRSNGYNGVQMIKLIEEIKKDLQFGKVDASEAMYWKDIKAAAQSVIEEWEQKHAQLIKSAEEEFLRRKMGKMNLKEQNKQENKKEINLIQRNQLIQIKAQKQQKNTQKPQTKIFKQQINLLDL